jgi:hypothetical protein
METAETSFLILNLGVRFEQMGNADAESTVAPLPGKMATLRKILLHPGEEPPGPASYLPMRIKFLRPRTTAGLRFRQVGKSSSSGCSRKRQRRFQSVSAYLNTGQTS